jgi:hypothetical protein
MHLKPIGITIIIIGSTHSPMFDKLHHTQFHTRSFHTCPYSSSKIKILYNNISYNLKIRHPIVTSNVVKMICGIPEYLGGFGTNYIFFILSKFSEKNNILRQTI